MKKIDTSPDFGYEPKELQDYHLGPARSLKTYYTQDQTTGLRQHSLHQIQVDGVDHRILETEPIGADTGGLTIVSKRGFGEHIDGRISYAFHTRLATALPDARIISHAMHGIGSHAQVSMRQFSQYGLDSIAKQGLKLLDTCCKGEQVILVGTSMGSAVANKLVNLNTQFGDPVDIAGVVLNAPALVRPERVGPVMVRRFLPALIGDMAVELLARTPRDRLVQAIGNLAASRASIADALAASHQLFDLLHGTSEADRHAMLKSTKTSVIIGAKDPLCETDDWRMLEPYYPNLKIHLVQKGHNMIFKPDENADKVAKTMRRDGLYSDKLIAA